MAPVVVEKARRCPSTDPENTTPGMALTAADCAGLQRFRVPHGGGGVNHTRSPLSRRSANKPPPTLGSGSVAVLFLMLNRPMSDSATYTLDSSAADPHCTPPLIPPLPT